MKRSTSANSTISSNLLLDLGASHAEDRAVQEDVLAPGQLGVEARADLEQRPDAPVEVAPCPSSGSVMRERILSSVLLPAPLRPMMPTTSPSRDVERDVAQRPEALRRVDASSRADRSRDAHHAFHQRLAERAISRSRAELVLLSEVRNANDARRFVRH